MPCDQLLFSGHALDRMFDRGIAPNDIRVVIESGETIAVYPDDTPLPSRLMLGQFGDEPIHVVVAEDSQDLKCIVVTVYRPDPQLWDEAFRQRRPQ